MIFRVKINDFQSIFLLYNGIRAELKAYTGTEVEMKLIMYIVSLSTLWMAHSAYQQPKPSHQLTAGTPQEFASCNLEYQAYGENGARTYISPLRQMPENTTCEPGKVFSNVKGVSAFKLLIKVIGILFNKALLYHFRIVNKPSYVQCK